MAYSYFGVLADDDGNSDSDTESVQQEEPVKELVKQIIVTQSNIYDKTTYTIVGDVMCELLALPSTNKINESEDVGYISVTHKYEQLNEMLKQKALTHKCDAVINVSYTKEMVYTYDKHKVGSSWKWKIDNTKQYSLYIAIGTMIKKN